MIPLVHPIVGADEKKVLNDIIDSRILASGKYVQEFELECARFIGTKHAVAVSSGTTALHAALLACGIKPGDKVLTTSLSFIATANSILFCGAKPVFADIDPETFNISPESAERALKKEKNIKAVIVVHLYGTPADMDAFAALRKKYKFKLIEDCAQAHGALYRGKVAGSFGDMSAFSYYATKNIMTGEGGMVHTDNSRLDTLTRQIINHGRGGHSEHVILGYNFRLTNLAAGIGLVQLRKLNEWNALRRENAAYLTGNLRDLDFLKTPHIPAHTTPVFHQYTVRIRKDLRTPFMNYLSKQGVGCGIYYPTAMYQQPVYRKLGYRNGLCPGAEKASREVLSLPVHPALTKRDLEQIVDAIRNFKK